jgi:thymidylate kinase
MIDGLLIEGTDYAGKTAVCQEVHRRLSQAGVPSRQGHCYVHDLPLLDHFLAKAKQTEDLLQIDWYYSANILVDLGLCQRQLPEDFLVQDRHWLSQVGRNRFFHPHASELPSALIDSLHLPFTHSVYLTSSIQTKRERAKLRPPKSPRDALLRKDARLHQAYDEYLISILPKQENWRIIDTSALSVDEVAARILKPLQGLASGDVGARREVGAR